MIKQTHDSNVARSLDAMAHLFADYHPRDFDVRLWEGTCWPAETDSPRFTLVLNHPGALRRMFSEANDLALGEAYIHSDFDIEGDLEAVFPVGDKILETSFSLPEKLRVAWDLYHLPRDGVSADHHNGSRTAAHLRGRQRSLGRDKQAVTYHYNVSNDFYRLWLDDRMVYSCAYFKSPDDSIDQAQEQKLDHLCHKLRLKKGERLLDIGCGWGGLIRHAAERYGVDATGVTLSEPQAELANQRIKDAGLADRCRAQVRDYRTIEGEGVFDKIVSVGMVEHVGESQLPTYFATAHRLLKPGGVFVNHGITRSAWVQPPKGPNFIHAYVFPDGELMPIHVRMGYAERAGFEVRDAEDLREHYAMTLRHWVRRLEDRRDEALKIIDDVTYRIWKLYMTGSAYNFAHGGLNLYQAVLSKMDSSGNSHLPLTRADWYVS